MTKLSMALLLALATTSILLPIAGISINFALLVSVGGVIGFMSGLLGVGGGFLMTPVLMMIGVSPTIAAASDTNAIIATSASGVAAHFRLKNVDVRMGTVCLVGGLIGSAIGVQVIKLLRAMGNADVLITMMYIFMLGGVGLFMLRDSLKKLRRGLLKAKGTSPSRSYTLLDRLPLQVEFARSGVRHSLLLPLALCGLVGVMTAIMGVGGGFLLVPAMVYLLGMPAHVAVGTSLFQILFTCMGATAMQAGNNFTVDVVLALMVAAGSTIGAQLGARVTRWFRGEQLMILLGVLALAVGLKMAVGIIVPPENLLSATEMQAALDPSSPPAVLPAVELVRRLACR